MKVALLCFIVACGGSSGQGVPDAGDAGTTPPALKVSASSLDFGLMDCGATEPSSQTLTISNSASGGSFLTYTVRVFEPNDFSLTSPPSGSLAPGASTSVVVAASPIPTLASAGDVTTGSILVTSNDPANAAVVVPLKKTAHGATFSISPSSLDFGQVPVAAFGPTLSVTLTNTGNASALVTLAPPVAPSISMGLSGGPKPVSVAPSATVQGSVMFNPTAPGLVQTSATLAITGPSCGAPAVLPIRGQGMDGVVGVSPGGLDFGLVPCGTTAAGQSIIVYNTGNVAFSFNAVLGLGAYSPFTVSPSSASVAPSAGVNVVLTPSPIPQVSAVTPNLYGDNLTITTTVFGDTPHVVPLNQTAAGAIITASPNPLSFNHQLVGATATSTLTFTNAGNVTAGLSLSAVSPFTINPSIYVPASSSAPVTASYYPYANALGIEASSAISVSTSTVLCAALPSIPVTATPIDDATVVAVGWYHTCVLGVSGNLYCWGDNSNGELGDGTTTTRTTPTLAMATGVTSIAAGDGSTCATRYTGAQCWGSNGYGQLGDGDTHGSVTPSLLSSLSGVQSVSGQNAYFCALLGTGGIDCWGSDTWGTFGSGDNSTAVTLPVTAFEGFTDVVAAANNTMASCVVLSGGSMECSGANTYGELGNGTTTDSNTPVVVSGVSTATAVGATDDSVCALLSTGSVTCWGYGAVGTLGNGANASASTPVAVSGLTDATMIAGGGSTICAVRSGGTIVCWGDNSSGELGDGTYTSSNVPVTVSTLNNATQVAQGEGMGCAIHDKGQLSCWGYGILGDGNFEEKMTTPVAVSGFN